MPGLNLTWDRFSICDKTFKIKEARKQWHTMLEGSSVTYTLDDKVGTFVVEEFIQDPLKEKLDKILNE